MPRLLLLMPVFTCFLAVLFVPSASLGWAGQEHSPEQIKFFAAEIKPILVEHCFKCHGAKGSPKGGLFLTSRQGLLKGGDTGPAVSLESPRESVLLDAVNYESYEMPPSGKLPQATIAALTKWVEMGLPWTPGDEVEHAETDEHGPPPVNDETKKFWSFQPVTRPEIPAVNYLRWVQTPIDAFVLQGLEEAGLQPSPPATKTALLRRAYYDLIGLPPSPEEVQAFLSNDAPDAFERVVDQLLESPHYGERWGRHWLDLVRYAETNSYERDGDKPFVWRYRDYVIRSFNADKPYDQFVKEQIAGDELDRVTSDSIIATGYYRLGIWQDEPVDPKQELFEDLDDLVRTTGEVFLGMTVGCARCHDHKLDPIPQADYYGMLAFFRNVQRLGERSHESVLAASVRVLGTEDSVQHFEQLVREHKEATNENQKELGRLDRRIRADLVGVENDEWKAEQARIGIAKTRIGKILTPEEFERYVALTADRDQLRQFRPPGNEQALCVKEHGRTSPPTHVLIRGNAHVAGEAVEPHFPSVLSPPPPQVDLPAEGVESTGRRLALAKWLASRDNPLTARVMANRIWHYHFGRGIVRSTSDFGFQGIAPTHPELLDWLASEFVDGDWRMKRLHKLIMLSSTYQMSSQPNEQAFAKDPINNLMWRFDMRRLSAEEIRDSILAVNGSLNREKMFGPSVFVSIPAEVLAGQSRPGEGWGQSSPEDRARRSIYIRVKRSLVVPMMASFDGADTDASCPIRFVTTQPTQALGMLNSDLINEQADVFAKYLMAEAGSSIDDQIALGLRRATQREPTVEEIQRGEKLITTLQQKYQLSPEAALKQFCITALNLNEFMYLD
ncbi:MAG TPA: PSD1 and planctomycete cytochrome C domain-containing protein [Pirellulaceae bacterium]|nr:PSD1 and planctomycete cytochrome C domain-containing protein [Pirellulaceae bacterium]